MWILSVPSFTWIPVDTSTQSTPYARAGHTCDIWDSQMVVVGGFIDANISCESPGTYVFNTSSLEWVNSFTSLTSVSSNPLSQQPAQIGSANGLQGSFGYTVPEAVISVIGGNALGGATITTPIASATAGPLATGKPVTYTVTDSNGGTIVTTAVPNPGSVDTNEKASSTNVGAAIAGGFAGLLAITAGYLAFCALLYRKQLKQHKRQAMLVVAHKDSSGVSSSTYDVGRMVNSSPVEHERESWLSLARASRLFGGRTSTGEGYSEGKNAIEGIGSETLSGHQGGNPGGYRVISGYRPPYSMSGGAGSWHEIGFRTPHGSQEDLLSDFEPSYWGVLLHPRRSLRVINR
jgi:hypothetical protein